MEQFLEGSFPALVDGRGGAERCLDCRVVGAVEFHEVTVPDEDGDYTFTAYFSNVGDELLRKKAEKNYWKNLTANFIAQKPART